VGNKFILNSRVSTMTIDENEGWMTVTVKDAAGGTHDVRLDVMEANAELARLGAEGDEATRAASWVEWLAKKNFPAVSRSAALKVAYAVTEEANRLAEASNAPAKVTEELPLAEPVE
jgi:hypothetical protein